MPETLVIQSRMFDLLGWLLPKASTFPKPYRYTLTTRLMDAALDLQDALIAAETSRGARRRDALLDADSHLARLRTYLRLVYEWRWLSQGQFRHVSQMHVEIGRLLGGWIKAEARPGRTARAPSSAT